MISVVIRNVMRFAYTDAVLVGVLAVTSAAAEQLPQPDHIVIVIEENKSFTDIIGSKNAPYLNSLLKRGALLTESYGLHHPSQPNYLVLFSGNDQGICNDECPTDLILAPNLAASLRSQQKTFVGFAEDLPTSLTTCKKGNYARKHCPWLDFANIPAAASLDFSKFPQTAAGFAQLPTVAIVIPNLIHDMHSATVFGAKKIPREVSNGDQWLEDHADAYAQWATTHNSLLIVTWDEDRSRYKYPASCAERIDTAPPHNHIPTILVGQMVKPGSTVATTYMHYDLLRTIEDMYGLTPIGASVNAQAISGIWQ
jgi:phosphatidylinositol-3-phosphatase